MSTITKNTETRVGSNRRVSPPSMNGRRPVHKTCTINLRLTEAEKNYLLLLQRVKVSRCQN